MGIPLHEFHVSGCQQPVAKFQVGEFCPQNGLHNAVFDLFPVGAQVDTAAQSLGFLRRLERKLELFSNILGLHCLESGLRVEERHAVEFEFVRVKVT